MLRSRALIANLLHGRHAHAVITLAGVADRRERAAISACAVLLDAGGPASPSAGRAQCCAHAAAAEASRWRGLHSAAVAASAADASRPSAPPGEPSLNPAGRQVLYKGRGMQVARLLVRMKVFQLAGIAALAVPINTFLATGSVAGTQVVMASALVVGAGAASSALWYYSRRYVGELALLPPEQPGQPPRLRFSVLDFWGNRQDNDVPLQALVPPLQHLPDHSLRAALREPLLPVDVEGDRQYFLSVRYGEVLSPRVLQALLTGQLEGRQLKGAADG